MTSQLHRYATIRCDGCGAVHGAPGEHEGVAEARGAALTAGWRLVAKLGKNGRPARLPDVTNP